MLFKDNYYTLYEVNFRDFYVMDNFMIYSELSNIGNFSDVEFERTTAIMELDE